MSNSKPRSSRKRSPPADDDFFKVDNDNSSPTVFSQGVSSRTDYSVVAGDGNVLPTKKKSLRRYEACIPCRVQHRTCDGAKPTCALCARVGRTCSYQERHTRAETKSQRSSKRKNSGHLNAPASMNEDRILLDAFPPPSRLTVNNNLVRSLPTPFTNIVAMENRHQLLNVPSNGDQVAASLLTRQTVGNTTLRSSPALTYTHVFQTHSNQTVPTPSQGDNATAPHAFIDDGRLENIMNGRSRIRMPSNDETPRNMAPLMEGSFPIIDGNISTCQFFQTSQFAGFFSMEFTAIQGQHLGQITVPATGLDNGHMENGGNEIPKVSVILEMVNIFFEHIHPLLPCLYESHILASICPGGSLTKPNALTFAILAISAHVHPDDNFRLLAKKWYALARSHYDESESGGQCSLHNVQAGIYICLYMYLNADYKVWFFIAKVYRMACALGLSYIDSPRQAYSSYLPHPKSEQDLEERRRAFWGIFVLDRYVSLGYQWAMTISDRDIFVNFPVRDDVFQSGKIERMLHIVIEPFVHNLSELISASSIISAPQPVEEQDPFHYLCKLLVLVGRIVAYRNFVVHKNNPNSPSDIKEYYELDTTLAKFHLTLPRKFHVGVISRELVHVTQLHVMLHMATILLYHPSSRAALSDAVHMDSQHFIKCVSAAENIARLLKTVIHISPSSISLQNPFLAPCLFLAAGVLCTKHLDSLHRSALSFRFPSNYGRDVDNRDGNSTAPGPSPSSSITILSSVGKYCHVPTDVDIILQVLDQMKDVWPAIAGNYKDSILIGLRRDSETFVQSFNSPAN